MEQLLKEVKNRFTLFPIQYPKIYEFFQLHEAGFWTTEEIDLKNDIVDWNEKLNDDERYFIKNILAFFAASDGIVNENLVLNFYNNIQIPEARAYYTMQMLMETIHCVSGDTYLLTEEGHFKIGDLAERKKECKIWNGEEWSKVKPVKTSDCASMYCVRLDNGLELKCTSKHKWYVWNENISCEDSDSDSEVQMVYTEDLIHGDKFKYTIPILNNNQDMKFSVHPYRQGYKDNLNNIDLIQKIEDVLNWPFDARIQWLQGFFDSRASCFRNLTDEEAQKILYLLLNTGIDSCLKNKDDSTIMFSDKEYTHLSSMAQRSLELEVMIEEVIELEGTQASYCFTEPKRHMGVFNGILTGQSQTYSVLIDTFIKELEEKDKLFDAINNIPVIQKKANWALKWISSEKTEQDDALESYLNTKNLSDLENLINVLIKHKKDIIFKNETFIKQLLAFVIVEGLFFSGSFCAIFWLKNRGLMPGLCFSNELISRDESLHCQMGIYLYSLVKNRLSEEYVHSIFREAVDIEKEFITQSLPVSLIGMNSEKMSLYIEYVADRLLYDLGYSKIFGVKTCPFSFMELLSFSGENSKVNFFEKRNADYQKSGVGKTQSDMEIKFEDEF